MDGGSEPPRFELDRLVSYDEDSLVAELRRVASLLPEGPLTRRAFDRVARVDSSTLGKRFGDWRAALTRAGLADRYSGQVVSETMRTQPAKRMSDDELLDELRRVAAKLGTRTLTVEAFGGNSNGIAAKAIVRRFGSWPEGLRCAGLDLSPLGRRWSEEDYFENLLVVWTHYGRAPRYAEMNLLPSKIRAGAYGKRFGTWGRAKVAFVERVNAEAPELKQGRVPSETDRSPGPPALPEPPAAAPRAEDKRTIPLGLRYRVLSRDRFRCQRCGRSPATELGVVLHIDHVHPLAAGGKTVEENLGALCAECNLGKGARVETKAPR